MRKLLFIVITLSFFVILPGVFAQVWWNDSYNYRYPIISSSTEEYPFSVNDTFGISNSIIWSYIGNNNYLYCENSGCDFGSMAIANETDEKYWENETSRTGRYPTYVWDSNYMGVWHFGESSGNATDSTSNDNDATITDITSYSVAGTFGNAFDFESSSSNYIYVPDDASLDFQDHAFTIEAWIKLESDTVHMSIADKWYDGANRGYTLYVYDDNTIYFAVGNSAGGDNVGLFSNATVVAGGWYYIVATWNTTTAKIYVNGTLDNSVNGALGPAANTKELNIGRTWNSANYFDGIIDELRISNVSRSEDYIRNQWYNGINNMTRIGTEETFFIPFNITFVDPTILNDYTTKNFAFINVTSDVNLTNASLEWNNITNKTNETMNGSGRNWFLNKTNLDDGNYTFKVFGTDVNNYTASTNTSWVFIDTNLPIPTISGVSTVWVTSDEINLTCSDVTSGCVATKWYYFDVDSTCSVSKGDYTYSTTDPSILVDTDHNDWLCLWVEDEAGNSDTAVSSRLKVDATNPTASISGVSIIWVQSDEINITCFDLLSGCVATKWYYYDGDGTCSGSKSDYIYSTTATSITVSTDHNDWLCLWVEDNTGNYDTVISSQLMVDVTPPILNNSIPPDGSYIQGIPSQLFKIDVTDLSFDPNNVSVYYKRFATPMWLSETMNCSGSTPDYVCNAFVNLYDDYADSDQILYYFVATDEASNQGFYGTESSPKSVIIDRIPPQVTNIMTNASDNIITRYDAILLSVEWEDNYALTSATLFTDENGGWENISTISLSGTSDWSNFTWYNSSIKRTVVSWKVLASDMAGNIKDSGTNTFTVYDTATSTVSLNKEWLKEGENIIITCQVDDSDSKGIGNYSVEIYDLSSDGTTLLTSDMTNSNGLFSYNWSIGIPEGPNTIICAIYDNSEMYYKAIYNGTDTFTADYTLPVLTNYIPVDYIKGSLEELFRVQLIEQNIDPETDSSLYYKRSGTPTWKTKTLNCDGSTPNYICDATVDLYSIYAEGDVIQFYFEATDLVGHMGNNGDSLLPNTVTIDRTPPSNIIADIDDTDKIVTMGGTVIFAQWSDNYELKTAILSTNENGTWDNTTISLSGTEDWSNFTWDNSLPEGTVVEWKIYASDAAGHEIQTEVDTFTVDMTPPIPIIWDLDKILIYRGESLEAYAKWSEEINDALIEIDSSNTTITPPYTDYWTNYTITDDILGNKQVRIHAQDIAGNWYVTDTKTFSVYGRLESEANLTSPYKYRGKWYTDVSCLVKDSDLSTPISDYYTEIYLNDTKLTDGFTTDGWLNYTNRFEYGTYKCAIYDDDNKYYHAIHNGTKDYPQNSTQGHQPKVTILSPENTTYSSNSVSLTFTVDEETSWMGYSLDDQTNTTIPGNTTLTGLSYDHHNIVVYASDTSGETGSSEKVYFEVFSSGGGGGGGGPPYQRSTFR